MKKIIIMLAVVAATGLNAQEAASSGGTTKKMWLSGGAGFGTNNFKDGDKNSNWNFGPNFGFFLNDKMAIGVGLNLDGTKNVHEYTSGASTYEGTTKTMGWTAMPFFRYYFAGAGNFRFFGDLYVAIGGGKTNYETTEPGITASEVKNGTFGAGLRPGFQYWFNEKWSMSSSIAILGFNSRTDDKGGKDAAGKSTEVKSSQLDLNVNFTSINFMLYYHF